MSDFEELDGFSFSADSPDEDAFQEDEATDEPVPDEAQPAQRKRGRRRKYPEPPPIDPEGPPVSVYQRLDDYGLLRKLTGIVMAEVSVPWHLREDAIQEVHATWAGLQAKPEYARNQLARYAYMSGQHAALKLRRTIGAVVAIPGAIFRTGRDSAFMESIGAAVNPRDVDDFKDMLELSTDPRDELQYQLNDKFLGLRLNRVSLSAEHHQVAHLILTQRWEPEWVAEALDIEVCEVERMINQIVIKLRAFDKSEKELAEQVQSEPTPKKPCTAKPHGPAASRASRPRKAARAKTSNLSEDADSVTVAGE